MDKYLFKNINRNSLSMPDTIFLFQPIREEEALQSLEGLSISFKHDK